MKKILFSLGILVAATITLTDCKKEKITAPLQDGNFALFATMDTKTANDGLATRWVADDALTVFHAAAGSTAYGSNDSFSVSAEGLASGRFVGTLTEPLAEGTSYDWYVLYPHTAGISTPAESRVTIGSAANSSQRQQGKGSMAHLAGNALPLFGQAKDVMSSASPSLVMKQLASVIAVNVTNNATEALEVSSVSFTAPEPIVGKYDADLTGSAPVFSAVSASEVSAVATLDVSEASIAKGESAVFYLAIKPFKAENGSSVSLSVNGVVKTVELSADVTFAAGRIKTLNFAFGSEQVTVADVAPFIFTAGDDVVISGTGFSTTASKNNVTIGGVAATVTSASADALHVKVPALAKGDYKFAVSVDGAPAVESSDVTYYFIPEYTVSTVFGAGKATNLDGIGTEATFYIPEGLIMAPDGSMWVTTRGSTTAHTIRRCDLSTGEVTTIIDAATVGNGKYPWGGAFDSHGVFYVCLKGAGKFAKVEKVADAYTWTEFTLKKQDGTEYSVSGKSPMNLIFDDADNMYVAVRDLKKVLKVKDGVVVKEFDFATGPCHIAWGPDKTKIFVFPNGGYKQFILPVDAQSGSDAVYYLGTGVKPTATNFTMGTPGAPKTCTFGTSPGMVADPVDGYLYVNDLINFTTWVIVPGPGRDYTKAMAKVIAGKPLTQGKVDGDALNATFKAQGYIVRDAQGNLYVADGSQYIIRKISVKQ